MKQQMRMRRCEFADKFTFTCQKPEGRRNYFLESQFSRNQFYRLLRRRIMCKMKLDGIMDNLKTGAQIGTVNISYDRLSSAVNICE